MSAVGPIRTIALLRGDHPDTEEAAARLERELRAEGLQVLIGLEGFQAGKADLVLLLGGDGFLMDSVRVLGYPATPIFGINFGSVGFLMNPRRCQEGLAGALKSARFHLEEHPVLEARAKMAGGREETLRAVNDFVLERTGGQTLRLRILVNGVLLNEYSGDGAIVSTSAGSTAYNLAAGGPVIHPGLPAVVITPLYPHRAAPFNSLQFSLVLPLETRLLLAGVDIEKRPIRLLADGRPLEGVMEVEVRDSGLRLKLLRLESHEFVATLARKFIGGSP